MCQNRPAVILYAVFFVNLLLSLRFKLVTEII